MTTTKMEQWPHGATVKLKWDGYGPYDQTIGWAKRDSEGRLITVYSLTLLDSDMWEVVEERFK